MKYDIKRLKVKIKILTQTSDIKSLNYIKIMTYQVIIIWKLKVAIPVLEFKLKKLKGAIIALSHNWLLTHDYICIY